MVEEPEEDPEEPEEDPEDPEEPEEDPEEPEEDPEEPDELLDLLEEPDELLDLLEEPEEEPEEPEKDPEEPEEDPEEPDELDAATVAALFTTSFVEPDAKFSSYAGSIVVPGFTLPQAWRSVRNISAHPLQASTKARMATSLDPVDVPMRSTISSLRG